MAPMLLSGGTIRTMDPARPVVDELAIEGERVVERTAEEPRRIDLRGRCALPGFTDSHVHFPTWATVRRQVHLGGARTIEETLERIAAAARDVPAGGWLRGHGWRTGDWERPIEPTREMLDRVAPGVPVALVSRDYHSLWVSSEALARADGRLLVPGGVVETDESGAPTGVLRENSAWTFRDRWSSPTREEYLAAMREALPVASARGVTAIHDKDGWLGAGELFGAIAAESPLTLRVWQSVPYDRVGRQAGDYVKAFMDGALGSRTAHLLDGTGVEILDRDAFADVVRRATEAGLPVAVHAIGDRANRDALDAFEATRGLWEPLGLRQRIEHAQLLAPGDAQRFAELGITASVQFSHAPSDRDLAGEVWAGMTDRAYAYRTLLDAGVRLANGSDAPVEELDPLAGIRAGVLRTLDERPAWHPEQRIGVEAALRATTVEPAWIACSEHERGRLAAGMLADLVVLDRDPVACAPDELPGIRVVATMLGGTWVHGADTMHE